MQEVKTCLAVTGGDSDTDSFSVSNPSRFGGQVIVDNTLMARRFQLQQETLPYAASIALDFATFGQKRIDLTGNLSLTAANSSCASKVMVHPRRCRCSAKESSRESSVRSSIKLEITSPEP